MWRFLHQNLTIKISSNFKWLSKFHQQCMIDMLKGFFFFFYSFSHPRRWYICSRTACDCIYSWRIVWMEFWESLRRISFSCLWQCCRRNSELSTWCSRYVNTPLSQNFWKRELSTRTPQSIQKVLGTCPQHNSIKFEQLLAKEQFLATSRHRRCIHILVFPFG